MTQAPKYGLWLALLSTLLITGCGIKPGSLEPPSGGDKDAFPHTYPMPEKE